MCDLEEQTLTQRMRAGDSQAFGLLAQTHTARLYALLVRLTGSPQEAEDLAQEALLRAFRYRRSFLPGRAFRPWLMAIGTRVGLDALQRRRRLPEPLPEGRDPVEDTPGPEERWLRLEEDRRVQAALQSLPPRDRAALLMRYGEGLSAQEVGEVLELSPGAVRVCLHRARARLAQEWGTHELS